MNKKVQAFLEMKHKEKTQAEEKERAKVLISCGLYDKVYKTKDSPKEDDFPFEEWDQETKGYRNYKKVPLSVTDEEYAEICRYAKGKSGTGYEDTPDNTVATVIKVIAILGMIGGVILGITLGAEAADYREGFDFMTALVVWVATFVSGMMLLGFSEIIQLLHEIRHS